MSVITSLGRSAVALLAFSSALAAQQGTGQPVTISIRDAFEEQAHPPLPRTHKPEPRGHIKASNYLANEVRALGLKPAGDKGTYFQNLPVVLRALDAKSTIAVDGKVYMAGKDFIATVPSVRNAAGPIGRMASGVVIYNGAIGDASAALTSSQVAGRIVLNRVAFVAGGGRGFGAGGGGGAGRGGRGGNPSPLDSALAVVTVVDSLTTAQVNGALHPSEKAVVFTGRPELPPAIPTLTITRALAEALLGSSLDAAKRGATGKTLTPNLKFTEQPKPARNVVAILPGADPKLKGEYVAIGAHSDHVGFAAFPVDHDSVRLYNAVVRTQGLENRQPGLPTAADEALLHTLLDSLHKLHGVRLDSINNGADDDGSGSVTLLEIAEAFAKSPVKPKRSIIFVWHVAEEKGLWGSDFFSRYPTVPRDSIVAQLNMDMVGRGKAEDIPLGGNDFVQPVGWHRLSSELGNLAEKVNTTEHTPFHFDLQYDAPFQTNNIYCRSDHANYARFGIPIVYFTTGLHRDYHQVTDEPEYMDYAHMAAIGQYMYDLGVAVANLDHRPVIDGNRPKDPFAQCVNNGVVPDSLSVRGGRQ